MNAMERLKDIESKITTLRPQVQSMLASRNNDEATRWHKSCRVNELKKQVEKQTARLTQSASDDKDDADNLKRELSRFSNWPVDRDASSYIAQSKKDYGPVDIVYVRELRTELAQAEYDCSILTAAANRSKKEHEAAAEQLQKLISEWESLLKGNR